MALVLKPIPYDAVPARVFEELMRSIANYSVAIARTVAGRDDSFEILGSGTCVTRGGRWGVLTAHHVLHRADPPVRLGGRSDDRIFFVAARQRTPSAAAMELEEIPVGAPDSAYSEYGPDLTFIHIPEGPVLWALRAVGSFAPLDRELDKMLGIYDIDRACIINTGYPSFGHHLKADEQPASENVLLYGGKGGLLRKDIVVRDGWDYVTTSCDDRAFRGLPKSFDGMSGGGIWSALFRGDGSGTYECAHYALVGVCFYQSCAPGARWIRGHFLRSIYERAWRAGAR